MEDTNHVKLDEYMEEVMVSVHYVQLYKNKK